MFIQVTASAGSGKTFQLTNRFLELLLGASSAQWPPVCLKAGARRFAPAEIMAITFTTKAAAEMKERLVASLKALALEIPGTLAPEGFTPEIARRHLEMLFKHYQRLQIRTIDSLLVMLTRLFAVELGLAPDFETVFDASEILTPLYDRLVSRAEAGHEPEAGLLERAAAAFSGAGGFLPATVWNERLSAMFSLRLTEPGDLATDPEPFARLRGQSLAALQAAASGLKLGLNAAGCPLKAACASFLEKCLALGGEDKVPESVYASKEDFAECVLAAGRPKLTPDLEAGYEAFKQRFADYVETAALTGGALDMLAFVDLADALAHGLEGGVGSRERLAHVRVAGLVQGALARDQGVPEAFCRLGARLAHLLIDEFQDTSRSQWQALLPLALECLAKGGGLFLVGDVKQAIYGWRGGDARLFAEAARDPELTAMAAPTILELEYNWRSAPRIVAFNNAFFTALAKPERARAAADALAEGIPGARREVLAERIGEVFGQASQAVPEARSGAIQGLVSIRPTPGANKQDIAAGVRQALRETLLDDVLARRPYGDAAILVGTNDLAAEVSRWLLEWDIPAVTENSLRLAERPLIRQLTAFLSFLDYPLDDASFWEFAGGAELFGAASGLAREDLLDWLAGRGRGALYPQFRRDFPGAWESLIRPYFSQAGLTSAYDLSAEIIKAYRVFERLPGDEGFARRFLEAVHVCGEKGHASLAAFLDFWRRKGGGEMAPRPPSLDAVRIMTMHKAKGLEFPVVIVPFQAAPAPKAGDVAVIEKYGLRFAAKLSVHAGEPYHRRIEARSLEQLNQLYVAWTRAAEELHLFIQPEARAGSPLLETACRILHGLGIDASERRVELGERPAPIAPGPAAEPGVPAAPLAQGRPVNPPEDVAPGLAGLPTAPMPGPGPAAGPEPAPKAGIRAPMHWLPRLKIYRNAVTELKPDEVLTTTARGEAAHKALEYLRPTHVSGDGAGGDHEADVARAVRLALQNLALPPDDMGVLEAEVTGMLRWTLSLPGFAARLATGQREREILDADGKTYRPDLYVEDEDGVLVVDYKTGSPKDEHAAQLRRYLRLVRELCGEEKRPARGLILYLDRRETQSVALATPAAPAAPAAAGAKRG